MGAKILFVHTSKDFEPKIVSLPLGMFALADFLDKKGHKTQIVNSFIEKKVDKNFDLAEFIENENPDFLCLSLHWHFQAYEVIDIAMQTKMRIPDCKIVLGGFTASIFSKEIMENFKCVDFIIRGDSEMPLLDLVEGKEKEKIPNLSWRKNKIIENKLTYIADKEMFDKLSFTNLSLMKNHEKYLEFWIEDNENKWLFLYNCGRGCPVNCTFCGGSCSSQEKISGRKESFFVEIGKAAEELKELSKYGKGVWYTSFDPYPEGDYYPTLFKWLRNEEIKLRCKFESWGLPTPEFIEEFVKTFEEGSEIVISPETGSEKIREQNKGYSYDNVVLLDCIKFLHDKKINSVIYFTAGLPKETLKDFTRTLMLVNFIRTHFPKSRVMAMPIEMEPGAPWFNDSEKYGVKTERKTFMDFYDVHKERSDIGYSTENFNANEILELVNLINAEAGCRMKKSVFLKVLSETSIKGKFNVAEAHNICKFCQFYNDCFC